MGDLRKGLLFVSLLIMAAGIIVRRPVIWLFGIGGVLGAIFMPGLGA